MADERYTPQPVPEQVSPQVRAFLEQELSKIEYFINLLLQYNEDNP